jgi:hypothetical protein
MHLSFPPTLLEGTIKVRRELKGRFILIRDRRDTPRLEEEEAKKLTKMTMTTRTTRNEEETQNEEIRIILTTERWASKLSSQEEGLVSSVPS